MDNVIGIGIGISIDHKCNADMFDTDPDTEKTFQVRSRLKLMTLGLKGKEIARKMRREFLTISASATDVANRREGGEKAAGDAAFSILAKRGRPLCRPRMSLTASPREHHHR
jgi:hypothetical protein